METRRNQQPEEKRRSRFSGNAPTTRHPAPSTQHQATWYFLATFFILAFVYFFWFGSYILFFQEQQSLFLYTSPYLSDFLLKPGGFLDLSGKFLTQFYISRFAGSVILSLILTLPGIILLHINKRVLPGSALSDLLLLIPSCLLLLMQAHYYHLMMYNIGFLLVLFYFLITILSEKKKVRYLALAFFPLFYYLAGAYASIFICIIYNILPGLCKKPSKVLLPVRINWSGFNFGVCIQQDLSSAKHKTTVPVPVAIH